MKLVVLWKYRWIKQSINSTYSIFWTKFIVICSSVALLLSIIKRCTQDGPLDGAMRYHKQFLYSDRRYVSLRGEKWRSCFRYVSPVTERRFKKNDLAVISFQCFTLYFMIFLHATCVAFWLLPIASMWILPDRDEVGLNRWLGLGFKVRCLCWWRYRLGNCPLWWPSRRWEDSLQIENIWYGLNWFRTVLQFCFSVLEQ